LTVLAAALICCGFQQQTLAFATPLRFTEGMSAEARNQVELTAVLWAASEGGFTALNPETGTVSEGETEAEALANLTEATELYLEEFPLPERRMPVITTIRIPDVA
jgi:predicted RNase H-like HicB family nuclease